MLVAVSTADTITLLPCMQAQSIWRPSAWAGASDAYDNRWPRFPSGPQEYALLATTGQGVFPSMYLLFLDFCGSLAAGSWAAWVTVAIVLLALAFFACWIIYAARQDNPRPHASDESIFENSPLWSFDNLKADIVKLQAAKSLILASLQDPLLAASPPTQPIISHGDSKRLARHHVGSRASKTMMMGISSLHVLLTLKVCDEMVANLRGRMAATCHEVTGVWLTDIVEARDAMRQKLANP